MLDVRIHVYTRTCNVEQDMLLATSAGILPCKASSQVLILPVGQGDRRAVTLPDRVHVPTCLYIKCPQKLCAE